jgi:hypothetical protein
MAKPVIADVRYTSSVLPNSVAAFNSAIELAGLGDVLAEGLFHVEPPSYAMFYMVPPQEPEYQFLLVAGGFGPWAEHLDELLPVPDQLFDVWYEFGKNPVFRRLWLVCDVQEGDFPMLEYLIRTNCRGYEDRITLVLPHFTIRPASKYDICCLDPKCRVRLSTRRSTTRRALDVLLGKKVLDLDEGGDYTLAKIL